MDKIIAFFAALRAALNNVTIGCDELKDALLCAYFKRLVGVGRGHVLVFGPTGTAKTHTTKGFARILTAAGIEVPYGRVQGNPDTMPSDFLVRRTAEYDEAGKAHFVWNLQSVGQFEQRNGQAPGLFQFDELDKVTANGQFALLEAMEEQQVTVLDGRTIPLSFALIATANTRKYDPTAKPLSRAVQDRFGAVVHLGYQSVDEDLAMLNATTGRQGNGQIVLPTFPADQIEALRGTIEVSGLPITADAKIKKGIVNVVKLTQQALPNFTDFTKFVKVPAGPRAMQDLYWEAASLALLTGSDTLQADHLLAVGHRALRGRLETTPEAEMDAMSTDALITKILAEVFAGQASKAPSFPTTPLLATGRRG